MSTTQDVLKAAHIDKVIEQAYERLDEGYAYLAEAFARRYFQRVSAEEILARSADELAGGLLSLAAFARQRDLGQGDVRVYNPRLEEHGWQSSHTVIEMINDDMPFIVDSVAAELHRRDLDIHLLIHPIVEVRRDEDGTVLELPDEGSGDGGELLRESAVHIEVDRLADEGERAELEKSLSQIIEEVRAAVEDWPQMQAKVRDCLRLLEEDPPPLPAEEIEESAEFLRWLLANHFTFLGYRDHRITDSGDSFRVKPLSGTGLGVLRDQFRDRPFVERELSRQVAEFARRPEALIITKSNRRSSVHRPVHMDYVGVKQMDADGQLIGERRFLGLFTSLAYSRRSQNVPILRRKVAQVLERAGFRSDTHDGKVLVHILETFPRDELCQVSVDQLHEMAMGVLALQERRRLALFVRQDTFERFVSCIIYVPRDRYDTRLRKAMQAILEGAFGGELSVYYTQVGDEPLARIHYIIRTTPGEIPEHDVKQVEAALAKAARSWSDDLGRALVERNGEDQGLIYHRRYREAFPTAYREAFKATTSGVRDIERLEIVLSTGELALSLYRPLGALPASVRFKIYYHGDSMPLSEVVPLFEALGFKVVAEMPYQIRPDLEAGEPVAEGLGPIWLRDFELESRDGAPIDLGAVREPLQETFARIASGEVESDIFNRLVLKAGLTWRQAVVLRAYSRYLRQTGIAFSQTYMARTLERNPRLARLLVELFEVRFDPAVRDGADQREAELVEQIRQGLDAISNLDEDRSLRRFLNLIQSTLRTNYFQRDENGGMRPYLAIKLDSGRLLELPEPRPKYEIWIYSPRVEAVHLRGGPVARGGIRWSDRRQDFRTEILGLMKAQMVKNAVIVPVGAKGGFILKRPPVDRTAERDEAIECYQWMIRGLLEITDNIVGGEVVPPPDVVRKDGDDPYLVVAADKGTATFSDIANQEAVDAGFWLGDAFASGGSAGYDHKKMGITARGAWESVKRHFREIGKDIQNEPFSVVGVGDMSGDVFGNGLLLSPHIRLLGAFNHLHIFIDPDPDPAASFAERQRLFELPRSTWDDYDRKALSEGGGIFDRKAKSVDLTPQIRTLLRLGDAEEVTPNELMQALLTAEVELLWFGGIGTFVKGSEEGNAAVGDHANDAVRVDAARLRAKVVGEGANLGLTQQGRIEYARAGGRLNTDAIDNSAGVDCSDHEVNIKIVLGEAVAGGDLTGKQRDQLLVEMTDEVARLVLRDNYLQTQAITVAEAQGASALTRQARLIRELERSGLLDRALEGLPDDEAIAERQAAGEGLTRPELAVVLAYSKIFFFRELLASDVPDDPELERDLLLYFPLPIQQRFAEVVRSHRLRREIISTYVTNSMVNRVGPTFVQRMMSATGASGAAIARAYTACRDSFDLRSLWSAIEALDNRVEASLQTRMIFDSKALIERSVLWLLRRRDDELEGFVGAYRPGIAELEDALDQVLASGDLKSFRRRRKELAKKGVPAELAARVAALDPLAAAPDIVALANSRQRSVSEVARIYFRLGAYFGLDWLRGAAVRLDTANPWQRDAVAALVDDLYQIQRALVMEVLEKAPPKAGAKAAIDAWSTGQRPLVKRNKELLSDLKSASAVDLAMLTVARHSLRELLTA